MPPLAIYRADAPSRHCVAQSSVPCVTGSDDPATVSTASRSAPSPGPRPLLPALLCQEPAAATTPHLYFFVLPSRPGWRLQLARRRAEYQLPACRRLVVNADLPCRWPRRTRASCLHPSYSRQVAYATCVVSAHPAPCLCSSRAPPHQRRPAPPQAATNKFPPFPHPSVRLSSTSLPCKAVSPLLPTPCHASTLEPSGATRSRQDAHCNAFQHHACYTDT